MMEDRAGFETQVSGARRQGSSAFAWNVSSEQLQLQRWNLGSAQPSPLHPVGLGPAGLPTIGLPNIRRTQESSQTGVTRPKHTWGLGSPNLRDLG
jgi:hypothetical protein